MTLRCKPGDLALVIRGKSCTGMMVTCIRIEEPPTPQSPDGRPVMPYDKERYGPVWLVDRTLKWYMTRGGRRSPYHAPYCPDNYLLPIRPEPDEESEPDARVLQRKRPEGRPVAVGVDDCGTDPAGRDR